MSSRRILILTAHAGYGHRSAARAVAAALKEDYGEACQVHIANPLDDPRTPALLRNSQSDYDKMIREMPELYRLGYDASDARLPSALAEQALTALLFPAMRDLVRRFQPDAIVSTYPLYQAPLGAVFSIQRSYIPLMTVVTDLVSVHRLWFNAASDLCLVATPAVRQLALDAGLPAEQVKITGIPVNPRLAHPVQDRRDLRQRLGWEPGRAAALVVGSTRVRNLPDLLRALNHSGMALQLAIVAGGDDQAYQQYLETAWHLPTHLYNYVDNMPDLMQAADFIVCKAGGLIVTEALACGLPLLLADVLPGQEEGNAAYVVEQQAGERVTDPLQALETVFHWLENGGELLRQRAANAARLGRPQAAFEVAALAWEAAGRGPTLDTERGRLILPRLIGLLNRFGVPLEENLLPPERSS